MEEILDVYSQPVADQPVADQPVAAIGDSSSEPASTVRLCFDERPCQLIGQVMAPLPMQAAKPLKQDYEYERNGTACVLLAYDLDSHQRYVQVREQRTKKDYAQFMDWLVKEHYPKAQKIHLVQDNLNTHQAGSFYQHLPLQRAYELKHKFLFHYTPLHASWLNMAEIEFSALSKQCLDRRIEDIDTLRREVLAWSKERNQNKVKIHWLFDTPKARAKFKRHYCKVTPDHEPFLNADNTTDASNK